MMCVWLVPLALFTIANCAHLPSNIPICHRSQPNQNECIAKAAEEGLIKLKDGNKELGIPKLSPLFVEKMEIGHSGAGSVVLDQKYKNVYIYGLTTAKVSNFKLDVENENCHFSYTTLTPKLRMEADYELTGKVLVFPINGHGNCTIDLHNLNSHHDVSCEKYKKNGKEFIKIKKYTLTLEPKQVEYNFANIVEGNEQLSNEIQKTVNENSLEVFNEVKSGMEQIWSTLYENTSNIFFSRIPSEEIFPI